MSEMHTEKCSGDTNKLVWTTKTACNRRLKAVLSVSVCMQTCGSAEELSVFIISTTAVLLECVCISAHGLCCYQTDALLWQQPRSVWHLNI